MKSGTPKTYTLIPNTGKAFDELVRRVCCHLEFYPLESPDRDKFEEKW